jgi:filamentous hemagglutinin family protein
LLLSVATAPAQVVFDGSFGTSGALAGPNYNITAAAGLTRGNNLFYSFSQFDLKAGDVATFSGPANIQNILSRVTGGNPSSIDGTIRSTIAGANFYFINPSGVLIGPHASVDVTGSFAVSTANYLKLADGAKFMAALGADDSLLSSAPVAAFGFLDGASGAVEVRGSLRSAPGTPLTVIGSSVTVRDGATLEALGSQINLTGVSAAGEITPAIPSSIRGGLTGDSSGHPPGSVVIRGGRLVVENAQVNVSDGTSGDLVVALSDSLAVLNGGQLTTGSSGASKGGNIMIDAPKVTIDGQDGPIATRVAAETASDDPLGAGGNVIIHSGSLDVLRGAEISVSTFGAADAGRVDVTTGSMRVVGSDTFTFPTQISANAAPVSGTASGSGGQVVIRADSLEVSKLATISASTLGDANAGSINIIAPSISISDGSVTTYSSGAGNGGDIRVQSQQLSLNGIFGSITALALGINSQLPAGRGGNIDIKTGSLRMVNDSAISASTYGDGNAGDIRIVADSVALNIGHPQPGFVPGISSSSSISFDGVGYSGKGGNVFVNAGSVSLDNGMMISVATSTPGNGGNIEINATSLHLQHNSAISASTSGDGNAGGIHIDAHSIVLDNGIPRPGSTPGISSSSSLSSDGVLHAGKGGDIVLNADSVSIDNGMMVSVATATDGKGGNIDINTGSLKLLNDSGISASTSGRGNGGSIHIDAQSVVLANGEPEVGTSAGISSSSITGGGTYGGNGGDVFLNVGTLTMRNQMLISAATTTPGRGGNIEITAGSISLNTGAAIESSSQASGLAGTVNLQSFGNITLSYGASISTSAPQSGAGEISLTSGSQVLVNNSAITARAGPGGGGDITIRAPKLVYLFQGSFDTQAEGNGGNLGVQTQTFLVNHGNLISRSSSANGGNITILSDFFLQSDTIIDASAPFGLPGTVKVTAPDLDLSASLIPLPSAMLDIESQMRPDCAVRTTEGISSLVILGRGGLPLEPGGFIPSGGTSSRDESK